MYRSMFGRMDRSRKARALWINGHERQYITVDTSICSVQREKPGKATTSMLFVGSAAIAGYPNTRFQREPKLIMVEVHKQFRTTNQASTSVSRRQQVARPLSELPYGMPTYGMALDWSLWLDLLVGLPQKRNAQPQVYSIHITMCCGILAFIFTKIHHDSAPRPPAAPK